ncbi:MAG TPA: MOSC domain-containing protein [Pseudonocardiaceae bacterium]|nr:MOSC domain-containing protein [Pseudonocardiaceae bacterium]
MNRVGTVETLWRYPVKSMAGERLDQAPVDARGILGDRLYAVRDPDGKLGSGKNTRRFRRMDGLLDFHAAYLPDLTPVITLPDGRTVRGNEEQVHWAIADGLDRPGVTLVKESVISHFDAESLHLVTTASMAWLSDLAPEAEMDVRRVRPNVVIRVDDAVGRPEDAWVGREMHIGSHLVVDVVDTVQRCVMISAAQEELPDADGVLAALGEASDLLFGVYARVVVPGRVRVGDEVHVS